jgi:NAD(P)H-dependent FMN reductase
MSPQSIKLIAISGSSRQTSSNPALLKAAQKLEEEYSKTKTIRTPSNYDPIQAVW